MADDLGTSGRALELEALWPSGRTVRVRIGVRKNAETDGSTGEDGQVADAFELSSADLVSKLAFRKALRGATRTCADGATVVAFVRSGDLDDLLELLQVDGPLAEFTRFSLQINDTDAALSIAEGILEQRQENLRRRADGPTTRRRAITIAVPILVLTAVCLVLAVFASPADAPYGVPIPLVVVSGLVFLTLIVGIQDTNIRRRKEHASQEQERLKFEQCELKDLSVAGPRVDRLLERLALQESLLSLRRLRDLLLALAAVMPLIGIAATLSIKNAEVGGSIIFGLVETIVVVAYVFTRNRNRQIEQAINQAEYELNLLTVRPGADQRAERLYLKQQFELKRYYDEALRQSSILSYVGGFCILGGFVVVGVTFGLLTQESNHNVSTQLLIEGAVGGILANFIAVVFLAMHNSTVKSMSSFHNRLVATTNIHLANALISRMLHDSDGDGRAIPGELLNATLAELAVEIVRGPGRPEADSVDSNAA